MTWSWIGVDEAGYGARLGPMVVSASWWQIDAPEWTEPSPSVSEFLKQIDQWSWREQFANPAVASTELPPPHLVADSKKVYHSGQGLEKLDRIVTSLLDAVDRFSNTPNGGETSSNAARHGLIDNGPAENISVEHFAAATAENQAAWLVASRQYLRHARRVQSIAPTETPYWLPQNNESSVSSLATDHSPASLQLASTWSSAKVRPCGLFSALVSEHEFNDGLVQHGNKANLLSATSVLLANQVLQRCPAGQTVVIDFDRHGGRKRYLPLLVEHFAADWPQVLGENAIESRYLWEPEGRRVIVRFTVDGERRYPVAAASLASKYARELGMNCVNAYWQRLIPELKASAGYPVDAVRMLADVESGIPSLPVPRDRVWRNA